MSNRIKIVRIGISILAALTPAETTISPVETRQFPVPRVVPLTRARPAVLAAWMSEAEPPPAMIATVHFSIGDISTKTAAAAIVPATAAAGADRISRK